MRLNRKTIIAAGVTAAAVAAGGGATVAAAGGSDDGERQATGAGADRARSAALALFDGARANAVERDSENGAAWEVELTRADGETVDVRLDDSYELVVVEGDTEDEPGER